MRAAGAFLLLCIAVASMELRPDRDTMPASNGDSQFVSFNFVDVSYFLTTICIPPLFSLSLSLSLSLSPLPPPTNRTRHQPNKFLSVVCIPLYVNNKTTK